MNGNDSPRLLDLSRSGMYTSGRMSDDEQDDTFRTPNASYVSRIEDAGAKPRMSMYSMKLFDPLMASPALGHQINGTPQVRADSNSSPLVSLPTPTNGNGSHKSSPGTSPMKSGVEGVVPSSRLSDAIVESLKNQELSFQEQLRVKDDEISQLASQLSSAYEVINTLKIANEDLLDIATRAIEREKEEKETLRSRIKSMFNQI